MMDDDNLRDQIIATLAADPRTRGADLRVGVVNGVAHLAGRTAELSTRTAAEDLAKQVHGVRGVVNRIEAPGAPSPSRAIQINLSQDDLERD